MIKVRRNRDGKLFTTDMSLEEGIYEMHFCTSYTQVMVQELDEEGALTTAEVICPPVGTNPNPFDLIAIQDDDTGEFVKEES